MTNALVRVPSLGEMEVVKLINGPEAFTPGRRVHPRPDRGARLLDGRRLLRARPRGSRRARAARRRVDRRRASRRSTSGTWTRAASAAPTARADYTLARTLEVYETYYDVKYPGHERQAGRPLRLSPAYPRLAELGAVVRREERLGAGELVRAERRARRRGAPPARLGRAATGRRRSAPSTSPAARRRRSSTRRRSRRSRSRARAPPALLERLCANRVARDVGAITYTQMLNARGGIECDFTVTRLGEERFRIVTGTAFGQHDLAWIREHAPRRRGGRRRHLGLRLLRPLGPAGPRDPPAADDDAARLPLHAGARARGRLRPVPRTARHLRRRARLGALLPDRVRRRALGRDLGARPGARPRRGRLPRDRLAPAREGLPRLGRGHHARTTRRSRRGSASR